MARLHHTILGVFTDRPAADRAIASLRELGYSPKDISIVVKDNEAHEEVSKDKGTNMVEGAAAGATTGGALGALAGLLVGIGAITIPGIGALFIGGPIAAALGLTGAAATAVSAAASGVLAGGIVGALTGLGVPEETARVYETRVREGAVVLAVPVLQTVDQSKVMDVFDDHGADQVTTVKE